MRKKVDFKNCGTLELIEEGDLLRAKLTLKSEKDIGVQVKFDTRDILNFILTHVKKYDIVRLEDKMNLQAKYKKKVSGSCSFRLNKKVLDKKDFLCYIEDYNNLGSFLSSTIKEATERSKAGRQRQFLKYLKGLIHDKRKDEEVHKL